MDILAKASNHIFENCIDFDLTALYPSIILAFNISPETCEGKIIINSGEDNKIDLASEFIDDYTSKDYINLSEKWFSLPSLENMIQDMQNVNGQKDLQLA